MKKYSPWFIALFAIIVIVVALWVIKTPIIASYLSNKLKTDVSISNIAISTKKMTIKNFRIKNPRGSKNKYAFTAKNVDVNYSFSKLMSAPSIVDSILVQDINLDIECSNPLCTKNNWTSLIDNINAKEKKSVSKKEVILKTLSLKNMDVAITGLGLNFNKTKNTNVPSIEFSNISNKTGFPTQELIAAIFKSAGLTDYLKGILENQDFWEGVIKGFKEIGASDNSLEERIKTL